MAALPALVVSPAPSDGDGLPVLPLAGGVILVALALSGAAWLLVSRSGAGKAGTSAPWPAPSSLRRPGGSAYSR